MWRIPAPVKAVNNRPQFRDFGFQSGDLALLSRNAFSEALHWGLVDPDGIIDGAHGMPSRAENDGGCLVGAA